MLKYTLLCWFGIEKKIFVKDVTSKENCMFLKKVEPIGPYSDYESIFKQRFIQNVQIDIYIDR